MTASDTSAHLDEVGPATKAMARPAPGRDPGAEPEGGTSSPLPPEHGRRARDPRWVAALIAVVCLLLTGLSSWVAARADDTTEHRLLQTQTEQAAAVLSTAVMLIQEPLTTALSVQMAAGPRGDTSAFTNLMSAYVGQGKMFESASLWQRRDGHVSRLVAVGVAPGMDPGRPATKAYVDNAFAKKTFTVRRLTVGDQTRIAYVRADSATGFAVYAERSVPSDRRAPVDRDSAFSQLHYAIYLGPKVKQDALSTTDVAPSTLPLGGDTATVRVPFGDSALTLVATARDHLGAPLSQQLPLLLLLVGLLLTVIASRAGQQLARGRRDAEEDAVTITALYEKVEAMYDQERALSERLQRALLPAQHPAIPQVEVAADYVAGARGVDIGGDWYSIVRLDDRRFAFVVGDVSGRGIDAVAVMAQARFTIRAYLLDGHSPAATLERCSRQFDIATDGHITTAVVGIGDAHTGEITIATAGHPNPLLLVGGRVTQVGAHPGWPLGVGSTSYRSTSLRLEPGSTLFCFTDGLVERRTEDIDVGVQRLAATLVSSPDTSIDGLVGHAVRSLRTSDASDDIAVLAIRWAGPR